MSLKGRPKIDVFSSQDVPGTYCAHWERTLKYKLIAKQNKMEWYHILVQGIMEIIFLKSPLIMNRED